MSLNREQMSVSKVSYSSLVQRERVSYMVLQTSADIWSEKMGLKLVAR